jgi:hypothetical protein
LIDGEVRGRLPERIYKRNGQAYLQGWDSYDDISGLASHVESLPRILTQPAKLGFASLRYGFDRSVDYETEVRPLLEAMTTIFDEHHELFDSAQADSPVLQSLVQEFADGTKVNALRARQLLGLYDHVAGRNYLGLATADADRSLINARIALDEALQVVASRESNYRVPIERVTSWRENPTAYPFGYLWTAHNLYYWWRDEGKAVHTPLMPCYLNILDFNKIVMGAATSPPAALSLKWSLVPSGFGFIADCLAPPVFEPTYPPAGLR